MDQEKVDYFIVGQGIAGTWLAHELLNKGKKILVFDPSKEATSSNRAAGIYNPITGRKMVKTWRADDFFPTLEDSYQKLEKLLKAKFLHPMPIYRPFRTVEDLNDWQGKISETGFENYVTSVHSKTRMIPNIIDSYGGIKIKCSGYVDLPKLITSFRNYLKEHQLFSNETFDVSKMTSTGDNIKYQGFEAKKVIFCEGPLSENPLWKDLDYRPVRGEIMDIQCDLPKTEIINQGVFMIPKADHFTVGATYDHANLSFEPQAAGLKNLKERLTKLFAGSFEIIAERAGVRPATYDRKPFIGFHPTNKTLAIFNGFGTKGVSLTPYFAKHFVNVLEDAGKLDSEVNVQRAF